MVTNGGGKNYVGIAAGLLLAGVGTAQAQTLTSTNTTTKPQLGSARIIEWDVPAATDVSPGAMVVDTRGEDNNRVWFVTRAGDERVYRVDVDASLMKNGGKARATAWNLSADLLAGGLKKLRPSHDRRFVVVRTSEAIQELDTQACTPTTVGVEIKCDAALRRWTVDGDTESANGLVSDIAVDDSRRIFSTGIGVLAGFTDGGYVQMLVPTKLAFTSSTSPIKAPAGTAFRWHDIGVNQCGANDNVAGPCNSGIDVRPSNSNLVYVSNQGANSIDELNLTTNTIRRWVMPPPIGPNDKPVNEPRQLKIDSGEKIWVTTGSGHLVSLRVNGGDGCPKGTNRMTRHAMPGLGAAQATAAGWGIAPDSNVVGYTDSNDNKVGMLLPKDGGFCQKPINDIPADKITLTATAETVPTSAVIEY